jgi:hypothetical protein
MLLQNCLVIIAITNLDFEHFMLLQNCLVIIAITDLDLEHFMLLQNCLLIIAITDLDLEHFMLLQNCLVIIATNQLAIWRRVPLEMPLVSQLLENFLKFNGTQMSITVYKCSSVDNILAQINPIHTTIFYFSKIQFLAY